MRCLTRIALAVAVVTASLSVVAPAAAATARGTTGYFFVKDLQRPDFCLGSTDGGHVYHEPCFFIPRLLRTWYLSGNGWIVNSGTGLCLTLLPGWDVGSRECVFGARYQQWDAWDTGWTRERFDGVCLVRWSFPPNDVSASTCLEGWKEELWDWVPA